MTEDAARAPTNLATAAGNEIVIRVPGLPPAKNGPSVLSPLHRHRGRVLTLLQCAQAQLPADFTPYRDALSLTLTLRAPERAPRGDPTNFLGGVADVLQRKPALETLGDLSQVFVYVNDRQLRRIDFREEQSQDVGYEIRIASLGRPELVARPRPQSVATLEIAVTCEVDDLALTFVNAFDRADRHGPRLNDVGSLITLLEATAAIDRHFAEVLRERADLDRLYARAKDLSSALQRLFLGVRSSDDVALLTELMRASARYQVIDIDDQIDLPLERLQLDSAEAESALAPVVKSAIRLLLPAVRGRLRECADLTCRRIFLDRSKNGTKTWCDMNTCGSRAKVRAWRERNGLSDGAVGYAVA